MFQIIFFGNFLFILISVDFSSRTQWVKLNFYTQVPWLCFIDSEWREQFKLEVKVTLLSTYLIKLVSCACTPLRLTETWFSPVCTWRSTLDSTAVLVSFRFIRCSDKYRPQRASWFVGNAARADYPVSFSIFHYQLEARREHSTSITAHFMLFYIIIGRRKKIRWIKMLH